MSASTFYTQHSLWLRSLNRTRICRPRLLCSLLLLGCTVAHAQTTREWTDNGGNNSWNNSSNWTDNNVPDGTGESAYFNSARNAGKKAYVTNEAGTLGLTRNLSGLSFLGGDSGDNWRLYAKQGEISAGSVKLLLHDTFSFNLLNGASANIYCGIEIANNVTCNMNGSSVILHHGLAGSANLTGSSSAAIDGNGGLTLKSGGGFSGILTSGKGTITLDNVNALQNARLNLNDTTVNRLVYITDSKLGSLTGNGKLTLANNLQVGNDNSDSSFTGSIDGSGSLQKIGNGTLTLSANNTYSGLTQVTGGTLEILGSLTGNASVNGSRILKLGNGGTGGAIGNITSLQGDVIYNRSSNASFTDTTGSGDIDKYGTGTLTLFNDNSNLGTIRVYEGSVAFNKSDSGPITLPTPIVNNSHVHIEKSGNWLNQYSGTISGSGSVTFKGGQTASKFQLERDQTYTGLTTIDRGTLILGIGGTVGWVNGDIQSITTGQIHFNRSDNRTFSGDISGNGPIHKYAANTLTLTGNNTISGNTTVHAGTLLVHGRLDSGSVTVSAGSTLGGTGELAGAVSSAGTVAPGASPGTLIVDAYSGSGTLNMEIDGPDSDLLIVSNQMDISSTTLDIDVLAGGVTEPLYLLAEYGSLTGTFSLIKEQPAGYVLDYAYDDGSDTNHIALVTNTPPTAIRIVPQTTGPTNASSLIFDIDFDLDVTQFDSFSDLVISSPSNAVTASGASFSGSGSNYVVTLTGVSGDGNLQLSVGGNVLGVYGAALAGSVTSATVQVDQTPPEVTDISSAISGPTHTNNIEYTASFSEDVLGFVASNVVLNVGGSVSAQVASVIGSGSVYTVSVNNISGDGSLSVTIPSSGSILDSAGNSLSVGGSSLAIVMDNSEPVISLNGSSATSLVVGASWVDPGATAVDSLDGTVTVNTGGDVVDTSASGTYVVTYDASDAAGNDALQKSRSVEVITVYANWAGSMGLTNGVNAATGQDPDLDGRSNLEEFAHDGNPLNGSDDGKRRISTYLYHGGSYFSLTLPVRTGASFLGSPSPSATVDGITYTAHGYLNLSGSTAVVVQGSAEDDAGLPPLSPGWKYISLWLSQEITPLNRGYIETQVEETP